MSQTPRSQPNVLTKLDRLAASAKMADIRAYSEGVLRLLLDEEPDRSPARSFVTRLSKAESQSRDGSKQLISESQVAEAFNDLISHAAGGSTTLRADASRVKRARVAFEQLAPSLISRKRNGEDCYPAEAVFLEAVLLDNIGLNPKEWGTERAGDKEYRGFHRSEARARFSAYLSSDPRGHADEAMNRIAAVFGF